MDNNRVITQSNIDVQAKIAQLNCECAQLKAKMSKETPQFSDLLDEIYAGKQCKIDALAKLVERQSKLTPTQQAYFFRQYRIEQLTNADISQSVALAMLILGNTNLTRYVIKKIAPTASLLRREILQMEFDDALRRAIDTYDIEFGVEFSTYAFRVCVMALQRIKPEVKVVSDTTPVEGGTTLENTLGAPDEFIEDFVQADYRNYIWQLLGYFNDKCQFVTMAHLGKYCEPMTYAEIGEILGVSGSFVGKVVREVVRQIGKMANDPEYSSQLKESVKRKEYHLLTCEEFCSKLSTQSHGL